MNESKKLSHHIKKGKEYLRNQPYAVRRQITVVASTFLTFLVVIFWVHTLTDRFTKKDSSQGDNQNAVKVIKDTVVKVYDQTKEDPAIDTNK